VGEAARHYVASNGDYRDYENKPVFRIRDGHRFDPDNIELGQYRAFQRSYPAFKELRERHGYPEVSLQVGTPAPIDLAAVNSFGYGAANADHAFAQAFAQATLRKITAIHAEAGDDVIFQVETAVSMVAVALAPEEAQTQVAEQMASAITSMTAFGPGLRHPDLGQPQRFLGSAQPLVGCGHRAQHFLDRHVHDGGQCHRLVEPDRALTVFQQR